MNSLKTLGLIGKNQALIRQLQLRPKLLGRILRYVEIETHSYCNRVCSFCPNSFLDRRGETEYFPPHLYTKVMEELREVEYSGWLSFVRYMEPLADEVIFDRVREARDYLPKARLTINTNGDYFNQDVLQRLHLAGLNELNIARYIDVPAVWSVELAVKLCETFANKHKLEAKLVVCKKDHVYYQVRYRDLEVSLYSFNYISMDRRYDRGGSLPIAPYQRFSPCIFPFVGLYFDSNGECMPCCNMRSDNPEHKPFSYGNIADSTLADLFLSQAAKQMRRELSSYVKPQFNPCRSCAYRTADANPFVQRAWNTLQKSISRCEPGAVPEHAEPISCQRAH